ncbi:hypothetical protein [Aeromonas rivipollensis]|uniref:hypothetical protein n=1 Tax=Aeromonas rivipollensis TaxID=948519 RepID=UPI00372D5A74
MSKHTPEPWEVIDRLTIQGPRVAGDPLKCGLLVASLPHWCEPGDSRRIVACVNACRGLPTDELEQKGLVAAVGSELLVLDKHLEDLLTELGEIQRIASGSNMTHNMMVIRDRCADAIAKFKVKGDAT